MKQNLIIPSDHKIVLMYEGSAEKAILETLIDNDLLKINRTDLLEEELFQRCALSKFCKSHMGHEMDNTVVLIRVIDSLRENVKIPVSYQHKFETKVITILTRPEIEILNILAENKYSDFSKNHHGQRPKEYCIQTLGYKSNYKFNKNYWDLNNNTHLGLVDSIKEYTRIANSNEFTLGDLLK